MKDNKKVCTMTFTNLVPNDQSEDWEATVSDVESAHGIVEDI